MNFIIFFIISISFLSNFAIYVFYKIFIYNKLISVIKKLEYYDQRLGKVVSNKRKERIYKKISPEMKTYNSKLYMYSFFQSLLLIVFYMIDLFLVLTYFSVPVYLPFNIPFITHISGHKYYLELGSLIIFILSFVLFTPISLRRPKII
uniref:DUF106 domain-containing protein n=1 Tax=Acidianus brierleyi TaxID=41673 RepID=A0A2U9IEA5_9CREN